MSFGWDAVSESSSFQDVLVDAADRGDKDEVAKLLKSGQNPDSKGEFGVTSLMRAALRGHTEISEMLIKAGAYVNAADVGGETPLHLAARNGNGNMVKMLLHYDAQIDAVDNQQWTPLMRSIASRNEETTKLLVENGANLNVTDNIGNSALVHAVIAGKYEIVKIILGSDRFNVIPKEQKVASLRVAEKLGNKDISKMLSAANEHFDNKAVANNTKTNEIGGNAVSLKYEDAKNNFSGNESFEVGVAKSDEQPPSAMPFKKLEKTVNSDNGFLGFNEADASLSKKQIEKAKANEADVFNPFYESNKKTDKKSENISDSGYLSAFTEEKKVHILPIPVVPDDVLKKSVPVITKLPEPKKNVLDADEKLPLLLPSDEVNLVGGVQVQDSSSDEGLPWLGKSSTGNKSVPVAVSDSLKGDVKKLENKPFNFTQESPKSPFSSIVNVVADAKNESDGLQSKEKLNDFGKVSDTKRRELLPIPIVSDELLRKTVAKKDEAPSVQQADKPLSAILGFVESDAVQQKKIDNEYNADAVVNSKKNAKQEAARPAWMNKFLSVFSKPNKVVKDDSGSVKNSDNVTFDDSLNKSVEQQQVVPQIPQESFVMPVDVIELPPVDSFASKETNSVSVAEEKPMSSSNKLFSASKKEASDSVPESDIVFPETLQEPLELPLPPPSKEFVEKKQVLSALDNAANAKAASSIEGTQVEEGLPWLGNSNSASALSKQNATESDKSGFVYSDALPEKRQDSDRENSYGNSYKDVKQKYSDSGEISEAILVRRDNFVPSFGNVESQVDEGIWLEVSPFFDNQSADDYADRMFRYDEELSKLKVKLMGGSSPADNKIRIKVGPIDGYNKADILCNSVKAGGLTCLVSGTPAVNNPIQSGRNKMQKNLYTPKVKKLKGSSDADAKPYWVNLGAFSDGYKAEYYWTFLQEDNSQITSGLNYKIEKSGANSVKLKVGPFSEKYIADDTCNVMRMRNVACLVIQ